MFILVHQDHLPPLPTFQAASRIPFSQILRPMFVLVLPCHLPSLPTFQAFNCSLPVFVPFVLFCHVFPLPPLQACTAKRGSGLIARTNLLQNSCAINSCNFPGFNYCKLKSSPSIFQMDWTVPPVHTLTPHVIEILAKRLEDTAHLSQEFQASNR